MMSCRRTLSKKVIIFFLLVALLTGGVLLYQACILPEDLSNLYLILNKLEQIKSVKEKDSLLSLLKKITLQEIGRLDVEEPVLLNLLTARDILKKVSEKRQFLDVAFFVEEAIRLKQEKRNRFLLLMDRFVIKVLGTEFIKRPARMNVLKEEQILNEIKTTSDKYKKQELLYRLANTCIVGEQIPRARSYLSELIELVPESVYSLRAMYKLGLIEKLEDNLDSADSLFKKIYQQKKDSLLSLYSYYQTATISEEKKDFSEAENIYASLVFEFSQRLELLQNYLNYLSYFRKGYLRLYPLKDYKLSWDNFERMLIELPSRPISQHVKREIIPRIGIYYRNLGYSFLLQKKYQSALDNFEIALKINPADALALVGKALAYLGLGEKERALVLGIEAKRSLPQNPYVLVNLGYIYTYLNMYEEAIREYKRCIEISPKIKEAYYNLGYIYTIKGRIDQALSFLEQAVNIGPRFVEAYNNIGYLFWQKKKFSEAIIAFQKAVELKPEFSSANFNLGLALVTVGKYEEAKEVFERILKYEPDNEVVRANLKAIEKLVLQNK